MRRQASKSRYPSSIKLAKLGQQGDYCCGDDGANALDGTKTGGLLTELLLLLDHGFHLMFGFGQAQLQYPNMLQNVALDPVVVRRSQSVLLRDDHAGDVVAVGSKVGEALALCRARWSWN